MKESTVVLENNVAPRVIVRYSAQTFDKPSPSNSVSSSREAKREIFVSLETLKQPRTASESEVATSEREAQTWDLEALKGDSRQCMTYKEKDPDQRLMHARNPSRA